jgi:uncharacterized membrane protein YphA (DoxX/SURF4 family)
MKPPKSTKLLNKISVKNNRILGFALLLIFALMSVLGLASHSVVDEFNIYWMAAGFALVPGLFLLAGKNEGAVYFSRIVVGSVFVVSGLIKVNDTVGFGIKLEEYFDENALGSFWAIFHGWSWEISFFVSGIEVILGLALLFGAQARLVSFALLGMTLFFGWLTYFTAECNDAQMAAISAGEEFNRVCVTDCGCFGDALRGSVGRSLTPWESFYKDLGLFFMVVVLVWGSGRIKFNQLRDDLIVFPAAIAITLLFGGWLFGWMWPTWFTLIAIGLYYLIKKLTASNTSREWGLATLLAIFTWGFGWYTYSHLPVKDYRPYAAGENIKDQMKSAEVLGLEPTIYATVYKLENKVTGEVKTINSKDYMAEKVWEDADWNNIIYSSDEPIVIQRGYEPPIAIFNVTTEDGEDIGEDLINDENYSFMAVMYDISKTRTGSALESFNQLAQEATLAGHHAYVLTSSPYDEYEPFRHEHNVAVPFYGGDEIFLKTIVRANPGLLLLKNGTIVMKWHGNDIPSFDEVKAKHFK